MSVYIKKGKQTQVQAGQGNIQRR